MGRDALKPYAGYECAKDYYDNYLFSNGRTPEQLRRDRAEESRKRLEEREKTYEEIRRHRELYGD